MRVFKGLDNLPKFKNSVITIGTFDGVHIGHQKLIGRIKELSQQTEGEDILLTFHPHPRFVINPDDKSLKLINTLEEKIDLLEQYGLSNLVVAEFSKQFSEITAIEYVKDFLVKHFQPKIIVIGYDHHFGKGRSGNIGLLREYKDVFGYEVVEITKQTLEDIAVSSTKIRSALAEGNVVKAGELLGHPFSISGFVVKGEQIGQTIGFPTANIKLTVNYKLIPENGVYAVKVLINGTTYNGMLNIGFRPTFEGTSKTIEVNIFDFNKEIYGDQIKVDFIDRIRAEQKFESKEALIEQLEKDKERALGILG